MQHQDERVNKKIVELCDELCSWERNTGRESSLFIIERDSGFLYAADSGKPIPTSEITDFIRAQLEE